ncbi:MAG: DUF6531 domain-containing protein [Pyrinomonadaceae bacterium]|nr:DUF6531 domain-containing protein [Pyrinomonadaceae bacterium]
MTNTSSNAKCPIICTIIYAMLLQMLFLPLPGKAGGNPTLPNQPIIPAVVTNRRPTLNSGNIVGSLRLQTGENFSVNSGIAMSEILLPGTPSFTFNGGTNGGIVSDGGATTPTNYRMTMNGGTISGKIHKQADPIAFPADIPASVPNPTGTRSVFINSPTDIANIGNWQTLADLTVNVSNLTISVPPGNYRSITLNSNSLLRFSAGTYNFSNTLTLNNNSRIESTGATAINLRQSINLNAGKFLLGANTLPSDVKLNILGTSANVNANCEINASVRVPNGTLTLNSSTASVRGIVWANFFTLNGGTVTGDTCASDGTGCTAVPSLDAVNPNRALQGQTIQVTLTGRNTNWVSGQTRVSFGGEISVGGAPEGDLGLISVTGPTTATADLLINPKAALAPRNVRVVTQLANNQTEEVLLNDVFVVAPVAPPGSSQNNVTTIAGNAGQSGFADGTGVQAKFSDLAGLAVGGNDAVYIADAGNHRIRVATEQTNGSWSVQTLAGNGTAGYLDGTAAQARFNNPQGVAVAPDGSFYVADTNNNRIRKILPDGTVSTIAGGSTAGFVDGNGTAARFNNPRGIAVDNAGVIFVADNGNSAVRRIDTDGNVTTIAGDGTVGSTDSPNARFNGLAGITVDGNNVYIYIADGANHRIRRLDSSGAVTTLTGGERGFADGAATEARFAEPTGIAVDGTGRLILADTINSLIRAVSPDLSVSNSPSAVTTVAGAGERGSVNGNGSVSRFNLPRGVAIGRSSAIFVADTGNRTLRRIGLPPQITSFSPNSGRVADTITIYGENFDGRGTNKNIVTFAKNGGGTVNAAVTGATVTQLTVVVPAEAATGRVTVTTADGSTTSAEDFTVQQNPAPIITDFSPRRGQVGTSVRLLGTDLKVGNTNPLVTFKGSGNDRLNALVNSATPNEVNVLVPNGAVTGFIELATAWGNTQSPQEFVVDDTQEFQITVAPSTIQAVERTHGTGIVYLNSPNASFTQLAQLSATNLPSGVTASFAPQQITSGGSSTLHLNLANAPLSSGSYPFTVKATALIDGHEVVKEANVSLSIIAAGQTTLTGRVLNTDSEPVIGATISLDGISTATDSSGTFTLSGVTAGTARPLQIDGRTANAPNRTYPVITEPANIVAGEANQVPYIFYLPAIDIQNEVTIVPGQTTIVETPKVPDMTVTIPANANLRNRDGSPVTRVSITSLPIDRTPTPLPTDATTAQVFTIQPGGAISDVPMPVVFPNSLGAEPDTRFPLYAFDHDNVQWYIYGYGRVSSDGKRIEPEINPATGSPYGITNFSWYFADGGPEGNPRGGPGGGNGDGDPCGGGNRGNNPVDFSTGMKIESNTDIGVLGSRGGIALNRTYTSEMGNRGVSGLFGLGTKSGYDFQMTVTVGINSNGQETGFAFLLTPEDTQGRMFSYAGRGLNDGNVYFKSGQTMEFQGDVVVKASNGNVSYRRADGSTLYFVPDGVTSNGYRLDKISDRNDNVTSLSYSNSKLTRITDAVGRSINLSYGANNFISSATDPKGRTWNYGYDSRGRLTNVTEPLGRFTTYVYDDNNLLTEARYPNNTMVKRITYSPQRRVIRQQFPDGGVETYTYELAGSLVVKTEITSPQGGKTSKRFNGNGYVIEAVDPLGQISRTERDFRNFPIRNVGASGCVESRTFDEKGNALTVTDKLGKTVEITYEPQFNNITSVKDKLGRLTTMTYDANGNLKTYTDAKNQTFENFYDGFGRPTEVRNALGQSTRFEYDDYGNISAFVDRTGARWTYEYDIIGNQTASIDPLGRRTTNVFDAANRIISTTDPSGATTTFEYDTRSNLVKVTNQLGRQWRMKYDGGSRLIETTDPLNRAATFTYNSEGDLLSARAASGRTVKYVYDARGQIIESTDPSGEKIKYTYDFRGNLVSYKDKRGFATTFVYDLMDRVTTARNPLGETSTIKYNAAGKISETADALGRRTTYTYDELDRTTAINYPDAQVNYTFDVLSRLTQVTDSQSGSISWTYDARDRVTSETTANGTVSYTYNAAGQRESMTVPNTLPVGYFYDSAGRLQKITQGAEDFTYAYDTLSRLTNLSRPNGVTTTFNYDVVDRLERMTHTGTSGTLEDYRFAYNINDEISQVTTLNSANLSPTAKTAGQPDAANRITQFGNANYTFDARGQNTSKSDAQGATTYSWDARGRLAGAILPNGQAVGYSYDALGRRASTTVDGNITKFLYDGLDVVQDQESNGNQVDYLNGGGIDNKLRMRSQATGDLYFLQDQIGSTQGLTNAAGTVVEWQRYTPYGESNLAGSLTRFGYAGREKDNLTGLIFNRARWYDPARGRFISEDPKGLAAGSNLYEYTGGNPISRRDPLGMDWRDDLRNIWEAAKEKKWRAEQAVIDAMAKPIEFVIGFGDNASGGITRYIRQWQGIDDPSLQCSGWYQAGEWTSVAVDIITGVGGIVKSGGKHALKKALKEGAEHYTDDAAKLAKNCILCFEAGTEVETADGQKPIEEIREGDRVLSYNEQTGRNEYQTVTQTFSRLADDVLELRVEGEAKPLGVTSEHPFFVKRKSNLKARSDTSAEEDGEWLEAVNLQAGDLIRTSQGRWAKILSIRPKSEARVYNFTVAENHNYFVGDLRLLTHNCGRRGNKATRDQLDRIRDQFIKDNPDYTHVGGGRDAISGNKIPEEYLKPLDGGTKGGSYPDLTFQAPDGSRVRINTVDYYKRTGIPTDRELTNAYRIYQQTGEPIYLLKKPQ